MSSSNSTYLHVENHADSSNLSIVNETHSIINSTTHSEFEGESTTYQHTESNVSILDVATNVTNTTISVCEVVIDNVHHN